MDVLASLIVENSLVNDDYHGVVHLENTTPPSLDSVIEAVLQQASVSTPARVPVADWRARCLEAAASLPPEQATLVKLLFGARGDNVAIDNMFSRHSFATGYFDQRDQLDKLAGHTPPEYWGRIAAQAGWQPLSHTGQVD